MSATDAAIQPESPGQEVEVHDLLTLAKIGVDELDDVPESARAAIVEAVGNALLDAEDLAFAAAANVAAAARGDQLGAGPERARAARQAGAEILSSLPDPATVGVVDAAILFGDFESAHRIADRTQITVQRLTQRLIDQGLVGVLVKRRVGGELVRPSAVAVYLM